MYTGDMAQPAVFILGMPRSGTTLVSMILNAHSKICISPETHYFDKFYRKGERRQCLADQASFERFVRFFLESSNLKAFGFTAIERGALLEAIMASPVRSHNVIFSAVLRAFADRQRKPLVGEKTPGHIHFVDIIAPMYPEARFVHIIRDPRDVVLSLRKVGWESGNMIEHLDRWRRIMEEGKRYSAMYGKRFTAVRYEDLLAAPEETARRLCSFLGVVFEPSMLDYHRHAAPNFDVRDEPWKAKNLQPLDAMNSMRWKRVMSKRDRAVAEARVGNMMATLGYPLEATDKGLGMRLRWGYLHAENALLRGLGLVKQLQLRLLEDY